jgi:hypothetical protein
MIPAHPSAPESSDLVSRALHAQREVLVLIGLFAVAYGAYLVHLDGVREVAGGKAVGIDFVVFWTAGRMVLDGLGAGIYDPATFHAATERYFGPGMSWLPWLYPPHILAFAVPLGALPYAVALAIWSAGGVAAFLVACLAGHSRARQWDLAAIILPITLMLVYYGQISLWAGAFGIGALRLIGHRPLVAGVLLGLLTVKPHYGLLIPLLLLWQRQWLTIVVASGVFAGLIALSFAFVDLATWTGWARDALPEQYRWFFVDDRVFLSKLMSLSPLMAARFAGFDIETAELLHKGVALIAVLAFVAVLWKAAPARAGYAAILALPLVTPYFHTYDLPIYIAALALWWTARFPERALSARPLARLVGYAMPLSPYAAFVAYALIDIVPPVAPIATLAVLAVVIVGEGIRWPLRRTTAAPPAPAE